MDKQSTVEREALKRMTFGPVRPKRQPLKAACKTLARRGLATLDSDAAYRPTTAGYVQEATNLISGEEEVRVRPVPCDDGGLVSITTEGGLDEVYPGGPAIKALLLYRDGGGPRGKGAVGQALAGLSS